MTENRVLMPLHTTPPPYLELFERMATYASSLPQARTLNTKHLDPKPQTLPEPH